MKKGNIVVIVILILIILGLGGYLVYDKVISKDSNNTKSNTLEVKEEETEDVSKNLELNDSIVVAADKKIDNYVFNCGETLDMYKNNKITEIEYSSRSFSIFGYARDGYNLDFNSLLEKNNFQKIEITNEYKDILNKASIELFDEDIDLDKIPMIKKENDKYYYVGSACGGAGTSSSERILNSAFKNNGDLILEEKVLFYRNYLGDYDKEVLKVAKDPKIEELISDNNYKFSVDNLSSYLRNNQDKFDTYQYTFKLNRNNNYYLYSVTKK